MTVCIFQKVKVETWHQFFLFLEIRMLAVRRTLMIKNNPKEIEY